MPVPVISRIKETLFTLATKTLLKIYLTSQKLQEFWGLRLLLLPGCFPPLRTVTTELLSIALTAIPPNAGRAVDIGCGPGSLTLLLSGKGFYAVGTDVSVVCLKAARVNAIRNGVYSLTDFVACDAGSCLRSGSADVCMTNPPFLPYERKDDRDLPLAGGKGLEVFKAMVRDCYRVAKKGGWALFAVSDLASGKAPRNLGVVLARGRGLGDNIYVVLLKPGAYRSSESAQP